MLNMPRVSLFWSTLLLILAVASRVDACGVCSLVAVHHHHRAHHQRVVATAMARLAEQRPLAMSAAALLAHQIVIRRRRQMARRHSWAFVPKTTGEEASEDNEALENDESDKEEAQEEKPLTTAMVASIGFYKKFISPLLPPACRFVPTCSQYGVQAIEEFGPTKGAILTAWRLLRCSPIGGKGYDPPRWPPVEYTYSSY